MSCDKKDLLLYAVTDSSRLAGMSLAQAVEKAIAGGVTMLQLREKDADPGKFLSLALEIKAVCKSHGVPFIVNDDLEVALACGADGVHVGQSDLEAGRARELLGKDKLLGVSAQTVEQALLAENRGADYLGVGAIFSTSTKKDADDVSLDTLRDICSAVSIPVVAIGGISAENLDELRGTGIAGVAVVSAIFAQTDPEKAAGNLKALAEAAFGKE